MTPARSGSSKRNSSSPFKPYTRGVAPIAISSSDILDSKQFSGTNPRSSPLGPLSLNDNVQSTTLERPGFPTSAQYKQVEAAYIQSLTPRRQAKALISQAMFDRIWDVLHNPDSQGETAQFRFWARKMFTLSKSHRSTLTGFGTSTNTPREVLLHDNLLVAVQEQLYDLLCHCHGNTGHGGRDKTCALIRKHYTWVPKDLVSGFIKACPTCIMKKCGNFDSALANQMAEDASFPRISDFFGYGSGSDSPASIASPVFHVAPSVSSAWSTLPAADEDSGPQNLEEVDPIETAYREAVQRARSLKASLCGMTVSSPRIPRSFPMSREVSLYQGLPNGWQYRHDDYASAHAEFMKTKDLGLGFVQDADSSVPAKRPRVPSILPLWGPEDFMQEEYPIQDTTLNNGANTLPMSPVFNPSQQENSEVQSNSSLRFMFFDHPQQSFVDSQSFPQEIDPTLLHLSVGSVPLTPTNLEVDKNRAANTNNAGLGISMSLKRAAAPPRLDLDFSTEKAFMAYRNPLREADITPDSPLMGINWDQAPHHSPTRSDSSSGASQLSVFGAAPPLSAGTTVSPTGSELRTPMDELPNGANDGEQAMMNGKIRVEPAVIELSDGIKQVCGL